jgi:hypothetical protein
MAAPATPKDEATTEEQPTAESILESLPDDDGKLGIVDAVIAHEAEIDKDGQVAHERTTQQEDTQTAGTEQPGEETPPSDSERMIELTISGETVTLPQSEVLAAAQQELAQRGQYGSYEERQALLKRAMGLPDDEEYSYMQEMWDVLNKSPEIQDAYKRYYGIAADGQAGDQHTPSETEMLRREVQDLKQSQEQKDLMAELKGEWDAYLATKPEGFDEDAQELTLTLLAAGKADTPQEAHALLRKFEEGRMKRGEEAFVERVKAERQAAVQTSTGGPGRQPVDTSKMGDGELEDAMMRRLSEMGVK